MNKHYDIVVNGGGLVGLAFAAALGNSTLKLAIISEETAPTTIKENDPYELRVSAITRASQQFFTRLTIWDAIKAQRVSPYQHMTVWDAIGKGSIEFDCTEVAEPYLGHIIENRVMLNSLFQLVNTYDNIDLMIPQRIANVQTLENNLFSLQLASGEIITTRLLIGADGANSWVRKQFAIDLTSWDYKQHALVATVKTELPHQATAWQRFLPTGPLAFLPLMDPHYCSIVWSNKAAEVERLQNLNDEEFNDFLTLSFEARLGAVKVVDKRVSFPLRMRHAKRYVQQGVALIGDAAHTIHPLAGQGVNLGLLDAACLAEIILAAVAKQRDFASFATLRRYERWRKGNNVAMIIGMEGFKQLFSNSIFPVAKLRSFGLTMVNHITPVKRWLIKTAMGIDKVI